MFCWASPVGECCGEQSAEHYFSRGLFKGKTALVGGFRWLHGETKEIGIGSLTVKNLCRRHNSALSELDAVAVRLFNDLAEIVRVQDVRKTFKKRQFINVKKYTTDGAVLERWFAKFLIGIFSVTGRPDDRWHLSSTGRDEPPPAVVKAVFGSLPFQKPMGLYAAMAIGENVTHIDGVGISPFFHASSGGLIGAIIDFKGFRFVIWLGDHALEDFILETDEGVRFGGGNAAFIYRMEQFNFAIGKIRSQVLQFTWDTTIRNPCES